MIFSTDYKDHIEVFSTLFKETFTRSENAKEGEIVGGLAKDLMLRTDDQDLHVFSSWEGGNVVGVIIFSKIDFADDPRRVFILAPVAVATDWQGQGVGQAPLRFGLDHLRKTGVDAALTYGDPNHYCKVGFAQITAEVAAPPHPLQFPFGWLGQSLTDAPLGHLAGPSTCVAALDSPEFW